MSDKIISKNSKYSPRYHSNNSSYRSMYRRVYLHHITLKRRRYSKSKKISHSYRRMSDYCSDGLGHDFSCGFDSYICKILNYVKKNNSLIYTHTIILFFLIRETADSGSPRSSTKGRK